MQVHANYSWQVTELMTPEELVEVYNDTIRVLAEDKEQQEAEQSSKKVSAPDYNVPNPAYRP